MTDQPRTDRPRDANIERLRQNKLALHPHRRDDLNGSGQAAPPGAALETQATAAAAPAVASFATSWLMAPTLISLVDEIVAVTDWPAEFLAAPLLAICASAIGTTRQVWINELWSELPCLWVAAIGDPGSGKTPSLKVIQRPVLSLQRQWYQEWKETYEDYKDQLEGWEQLPREKRGSKPGEPPAQRKLLVGDITMESLVEVLSGNPRGLVQIRDELLGWLLSFNQYKAGGGADRQHWLSIYSGVDLVVDRKGEQYSAFVHNPFVGIYGGIQPDKLPTLRKDGGDGLIDRFLIFYPQTRITKTRKVRFPVDRIAAYRRFLERLLALEPGENEAGDPVPEAVNLSDEAFEAFVECERHTKERALDAYLPKALRNAYHKLGGQAARVALTLHQCQCADDPNKPTHVLTEDTIAAAWCIVDCSANHLLRAFGEMGVRPADDRAERAVAWIKGKGGTATTRDIVRANVVGIKRASAAHELLKDLQDRGFGVLTLDQNAGPQSVRFTLSGM